MKKFINLAFFLIILSTTLKAQEVDGEGYTRINSEIFGKVYSINQQASTVIVIHGAGGARGWRQDQVAMSKWAKIINNWGYNAVVADLFSARGFTTLLKQGQQLSFRTRANDINNIAEFVQKQSWHKGPIGLIGFSQGGATILAVSKKSSPLIKAAVAFYPACGYESPSWSPDFKIQMHLGMKDDLSLPHLCNVLSKKDYDIHKYENATHTFDVDAPDRIIGGNHFRFNLEAYELARDRTKVFFDEHLKILN